MEKLIVDMMMWANVTEEELCIKKEISTEFGETLSWEYLCYVPGTSHCLECANLYFIWRKDNLTSIETISEFAGTHWCIAYGHERWRALVSYRRADGVFRRLAQEYKRN